MKEPIRWRDDPTLAGDVRAVLRRMPKARPLDAATQTRIGHRLGRYLALPLALTSWLTMKTAAASLALTAGAVALGAVVVREAVILESLSVPVSTRQAGSATKPLPPRHDQFIAVRPSADPEEQVAADTAVAAFPDEDTPDPIRLQAPTGVRSQAPAKVEGSRSLRLSPKNEFKPDASDESKPVALPPTDDLKTEAAMLELARRALANSPAEALAIADEHRMQFPRAALSLERELIRVDAFRRLGRKGEARALAESLRQRGGLYTERVDRLIEKNGSASE